jgi:lipopolysaccharide assembly LptE-like protein
MHTLTRRRFLSLAAVTPLVAAGCRGGFSIFGYQAGADALYDQNIKTVYVPLFNNRAFQTTPYRGFEVDVTQAVIREIGKTTTFRVTSDCNKADTELLGNIVAIMKILVNYNQQLQVREAEVTVWLDVVWRDLRDGTILSNPRQRPTPGRTAPNPQIDAPPVPFDPNVPLPPDDRQLQAPQPVRIIATGRMIPELGETNASAASRVQQQIAVQIVSMMEKRW